MNAEPVLAPSCPPAGPLDVGAAFLHHAPAVHRLANRLVGDPTAAQDVVQEVFLRLCRDPAKFPGDLAAIRPFLLTQSHGRAMDQARAETARARRERRHHERCAAPAPGVDDGVCDALMSARVRRALASLPRSESDAISLAFFGGLSYRAVALRLGIAEGTAKSRIRRGLDRMRADLRGQFANGEREESAP